MLNNKTVLVTGATGLIGYNLTHALLKNGNKVIALGRSKDKILGCYEKYIGKVVFDYIAADISKCPLNISEPIDYIFHAAGSIALDTIVNRPMDIIAPNITGTELCLEFLRQQEKTTGKRGRLIYFSSEAVYGKSTFDRNVCENETELSDALTDKRTPYSHSKRMAEVIVNSYSKQFNVDALSVRFAWVYGNAKYKAKQALFDFIEDALAGKDIYIKNPDTPRRDNIFMKDAIDALLVVAEYGKTGEAYNISSNGDKGNYAAADEIASIIVSIVNKKYNNKNVKIFYEKEPSARRMGGVLMNNTKLKELGWELSTSLREGIEILVDEVKQNVY